MSYSIPPDPWTDEGRIEALAFAMATLARDIDHEFAELEAELDMLINVHTDPVIASNDGELYTLSELPALKQALAAAYRK